MGFHYIFFSWYVNNPIHTNTCNSEDVTTYHCRTYSFKNPFLPYTICDSNRLDLGVGKSTYSVFRQHLLKVIQPQPSATFNICNFAELHLLTRLRLGISHLNECRLNHNFQNCIDLLCTCSLDVESASYSLHYNDVHATLLNELKSVDENILKLFGTKLINLFLYGDHQFGSN